MLIGHLLKSSVIEYPGLGSCVVFTQGCNFRCPYCHNPELVEPSLYGTGMAESDLLAFLDRRRGKLDAISITGGEPLLQFGLTAFIEKVRALGYLVKVDTNGSFPLVLKEMLDKGLLDYIAMDVKAPLERYGDVVQAPVNPESIAHSIRLIMNSGVDYEFKTTVVSSLLTGRDVEKIGTLITGTKRYYLPRFVPSKPLDPAFMKREALGRRPALRYERTAGESISSVLIR
jgi:pyruvate formate lyase activating enzyme